MRALRVGFAGFLTTFATYMGLVVSTAAPAQAWGGLGPVVVGVAAESAPVRMLTMTSPLGLAINTAMFGYMAYSTKDSWMPVLKDLFSGNWSGQAGTPQVTGFTLQVNQPTDLRHVTYFVTDSAGQSDVYFRWENVFCRTTTSNSVVTSVPNGFVQFHVNSKSNFTGEVQLCADGTSMLSGTFWIENPSYHWMLSPKYSLQNPYPDDLYTQTASVQCRQPDGTIVTITDTQTGHPDQIAVPSCADRVPGSIPWGGTISGGPQGGIIKILYDWATKQSVFDEYADCFGPTGLQCSIRVFIGGEPCSVGDAACADWQNYAALHPNKVECRFGSHVIDLSQCAVLKKVYKTGPVVVTTTDPNGDPELDPSAPPGGGGTGTVTDWTDILNPPNPPAPPIDKETPPDSGCMGEIATFNPVSWVYVPIKCALKWAFVPSESALQDFQNSVRGYWENSGTAAWATAWSDGVNTLTGSASGSGCTGPTISNLPGPLGDALGTFQPFNACSGAMADAAGWSHLISTVFLSILGVSRILQTILDAMGLRSYGVAALGNDWSGATVYGKDYPS